MITQDYAEADPTAGLANEEVDRLAALFGRTGSSATDDERRRLLASADADDPVGEAMAAAARRQGLALFMRRKTAAALQACAAESSAPSSPRQSAPKAIDSRGAGWRTAVERARRTIVTSPAWPEALTRLDEPTVTRLGRPIGADTKDGEVARVAQAVRAAEAAMDQIVQSLLDSLHQRLGIPTT